MPGKRRMHSQVDRIEPPRRYVVRWIEGAGPERRWCEERYTDPDVAEARVEELKDEGKAAVYAVRA